MLFKNLYIVGFCLFLNKRNSVVDAYNCETFTEGCPDSDYYSNTLYKCKRLLQLYTLWMLVSYISQNYILIHLTKIITVYFSFLLKSIMKKRMLVYVPFHR